MFVAKNKVGVIITSQQAKHTEHYTCPECGEAVVIRQSHKGTKYFAHDARHHQGGEGAMHRQIKAHLQRLQPELKFEYRVGDFRADVWSEQVVIEIQISPIMKKQIRHRQQAYGKKLLWLFGPKVQFQAVHWQCCNQYGKIYRYQNDFCECFGNIHPLTAQKVIVLKRYLNWESFFTELTQPQWDCLPQIHFFAGLDFFANWRKMYSTRYAKITDDYAQALYQWQIRSEQLPHYVGIPVPIQEWQEQPPLIWQGQYCYRLAQGEKIYQNELNYTQNFYLAMLVALGVCTKNAQSFSGYVRCEPTQMQLYQAYYTIWLQQVMPV